MYSNFFKNKVTGETHYLTIVAERNIMQQDGVPLIFTIVALPYDNTDKTLTSYEYAYDTIVDHRVLVFDTFEDAEEFTGKIRNSWEFEYDVRRMAGELTFGNMVDYGYIVRIQDAGYVSYRTSIAKMCKDMRDNRGGAYFSLSECARICREILAQHLDNI